MGRCRHQHNVLAPINEQSVGCRQRPAENLDISHVDDPSLHFSSEKNILLIFQAANPSVKNDYKAAHSRSYVSYTHVRTLLNKIRVRYLKQNKGKAPVFALLLDTKMQQEKSPLDYVSVHQHYVFLQL